MLFYQIYVEITAFFYQDLFGSVPVEVVDVETFGGKIDVNMTSKRQNGQSGVMHESRLTPCMYICKKSLTRLVL